jgi:YHS domain-containing protein
LCGGTVFTLILEARQQRYGVREHFAGDSDGLSEMDTLIGLAQVMVPDLKRPAKTREDTVQGNTTEFKICKTAGGKGYYPFSNRQSKKAFDDRVKGYYAEALKAMCDFVKNFIWVKGSDKQDVNLVKALLDLIERDDSINNSQVFYIMPDGKPVTKQRIDQIDGEDVCLESFLLGVWHYAIMRREGNTIGKATMNEWCPSKGGAPREYEGHMGENLSRNIRLTYLGDVEVPDQDEEIEHIEAEVVEGTKDPDPEPQPQTVNQSVNNPVVINITMNQSGNGRQYGYIADYHEKGED